MNNFGGNQGQGENPTGMQGNGSLADQIRQMGLGIIDSVGGQNYEENKFDGAG